MEWFGNMFAKDGFFGNIGNVGTFVGGLGQAKAAMDQGKAAKEMLNLQKDSYYDDKNRRKKVQLALDGSFAGLTPTVAQPSLPLGGG